MSKTLFWYVFRDLVKIFLMTSAVLAGIMSFGGLLKPLTQYGLNASQVGKILAYFMPATQTYSLPIAALFATTVVYGRLSADNELTACRASGISYTSLALPALVLGLILSIVSLLSLSFIVPRYTLKVEKVAFESLAEIVYKNIERNHQLKLQDYTIYAESAEILPPPADRPGDEVVVLHAPMFCSYDETTTKDKAETVKVPSEFYTASRAFVVMRQVGEQIELTASLEDGVVFPREFKGGAESGAIGATQFGPYAIPSPIKENTKFMDIKQLQRLYSDPTRSRDVREMFMRITQKEQENQFLAMVQRELRGSGGGRVEFDGEDGERYTLMVEPDVQVIERTASKLVLGSAEGSRDIRLQRSLGASGVVATDDASMLVLRCAASAAAKEMRLDFQLHDVIVGAESGTKRAGQAFTRYFRIPMPEELGELARRTPDYYLRKADIKGEDLQRLRRKLPGLRNGIEAEIHGRVSFAVSCFILVMVGCSLGMIFRTGNYLSAFALSTIPALFCIALIVTGQHVASNSAGGLKMGLTVIWSGNVLVSGLAAGLMGYLRRQ